MFCPFSQSCFEKKEYAHRINHFIYCIIESIEIETFNVK